MMNILYDSQIFDLQKLGGISRYFTKLIETIHANKLANVHLAIKESSNDEIIKLKNIFGYINYLPVESRRISPFLPGILRSLYRKFFPKYGKNKTAHKQMAIEKLRNGHYDIFHPTYYEDYYISNLGGTPLVITVHDMIHELYSHYIAESKTIVGIKKLVISRADAIIAGSNSTKKDLCNLYKIDQSKVHVVYYANPLGNQNEHLSSNYLLDLPKNFILYIGNRFIYKNFHFFVSECASILKTEKDVFLVCVGAPFTKNERMLLEKLGIMSKIHYLNISSDDLLIEVYRRALAFVFPSLYEGFGIPILEAMSCGCPVVLSNTSSFPEVAGNAGLYFDPQNGESIRESILKIIQLNELREELRLKGYERVKLFSWDKVAQQTMEVYTKVLNNKISKEN